MIGKCLTRIYFIHLCAIVAVWLAMYYPGADIAVSLLYCYVIWKEGRYAAFQLATCRESVIAGLLWQMPALLLSGAALLDLKITDLTYYSIFILQLWETPVMPIISLGPRALGLNKPLYYYMLFIMIPILLLLYIQPLTRRVRKPGRRYNSF